MAIEIKNIKKESKTPAPGRSKKQKSAFSEFMSRDIKLFGSGIKEKTKEQFYSDLSTLLDAGIDIKSALEMFTQEQKKKTDKAIFEAIERKVIEGASLSDALLETGKFSPYEYYSLKIGEESGRISEVLVELNNYFNKKIKQKRQLVGAFSYPVLVLIVAVVAVVFMLNFIVPMFEDVFLRFGGKLPDLTRFIIKVSRYFSTYGWWYLLGMIAIVVFLLSQKKNNWFRSLSAQIMLRIPRLHKIVRNIYLARFSQSMALLIASRTPLLQTIKMVKDMIAFYPFETALEQIGNDILNGKTLHQSMSQFDIFDNRMRSLVKVGEEVNQLDKIFAKLNKQYTEALEHEIGMISSMLEPVLIIFVGVLVAVILVAMYLPLFQLSSSIY